MAVTENPYRTPRDVLTAADRLRGDAWQEGFDAGRASRDAEVEALKSERATERAFSKECLEEKDRECHYRLKFSAQLAEKEAEAKRLREERDHYRALALGLKGEGGRNDCERHNVSMPVGVECVLCKRERGPNAD